MSIFLGPPKNNSKMHFFNAYAFFPIDLLVGCHAFVDPGDASVDGLLVGVVKKQRTKLSDAASFSASFSVQKSVALLKNG